MGETMAKGGRDSQQMGKCLNPLRIRGLDRSLGSRLIQPSVIAASEMPGFSTPQNGTKVIANR